MEESALRRRCQCLDFAQAELHFAPDPEDECCLRLGAGEAVREGVKAFLEEGGVPPSAKAGDKANNVEPLAMARRGSNAGTTELLRAALQEAFQRSRADIASWIGEVRAPEGMRELLAELDHVSRILITNSPAGGLDQVIEGLGLSDVLDQVVTDARKPEGMSAALDRAGVLASACRFLLNPL